MVQPANVGRYHVVGHLASGGMADIFLGKLLGPSGFERPVVLKRVLPKLAGRENVMQMFLDEARLAARIQHANVVHVQELVEEDGGFYLVMEFLEGESALGLMKRAARRRERVPVDVAVHVIAEACAGIHAAHELTNDSGEPLGIVHRDISPGNVFVTYAGGVKVLDFGIAKFKAKTTETQVGKVRGKFAYMSPEQCRGKPVDRRSDVFALGTLLFELTTGRRLFARETHRLTMKAVTQARLPPMKRMDPSYPDALIPILQRALAVDPDDRYPTAARLRRDLVVFGQQLAGEMLPEERLTALMKSWFPQRIKQKRVLLTEVRSGTNVTHIPEAEPDKAVELPDADTVVTPQLIHQQSTVETPNFSPTMLDSAPAATYVHTTPAEPGPAAPAAPRPGSHPAPPPSRPPPRSGTTRALWFATGAVAVLALGVAIGAAVTALQETEPSVALPTMQTDGATEPSPTPAPRTVAVPDPGASTTTYAFDIRWEPSGSVVYIDGARRGTTPLTLDLPEGDAPLQIEVRRDGYVTYSEEFVPNQDRTISGSLVRRRGRRGRRVERPAEPSGDGPAPEFQRYD